MTLWRPSGLERRSCMQRPPGIRARRTEIAVRSSFTRATELWMKLAAARAFDPSDRARCRTRPSRRPHVHKAVAGVSRIKVAQASIQSWARCLSPALVHSTGRTSFRFRRQSARPPLQPVSTSILTPPAGPPVPTMCVSVWPSTGPDRVRSRPTENAAMLEPHRHARRAIPSSPACDSRRMAL